jgi:hypothetical protein
MNGNCGTKTDFTSHLARRLYLTECILICFMIMPFGASLGQTPKKGESAGVRPAVVGRRDR